MVWECTAGQFNWFYDCDETVHIIEGDVIITTETGTVTASAGSSFFFPAGSRATWQVNSYVRKVAFLRHTLPGPAGAMLRGWKRIFERSVVHPLKAPVRRSLAEMRVVLAWLLSIPLTLGGAMGLFYMLSGTLVGE
jgi:hypothetical protein